MADCTCADPQAVAKAIEANASTIADSASKDAVFIDQTLRSTGYTKITLPGGVQSSRPAPPQVFHSLRFCHWNAPEYGSQGESWWTSLFEAATVAIAIANGVVQGQIADKQMDLAEGYYDQAKYKWDRFEKRYIPLEKKLLKEVSSVEIREMDCDGAEDRAELSVNSVFNSLNTFMRQEAKKLRMCFDPSLLSVVSLSQVTANVDTRNYNLVDEQWYTDYKNDQRWNRRSNVLNLGRNLNSEALQYGQVANALYSQVGAQVEKAANSLVTALGYFGARNDTVYPTTYLASASQQGPLATVGSPTMVNVNRQITN